MTNTPDNIRNMWEQAARPHHAAEVAERRENGTYES